MREDCSELIREIAEYIVDHRCTIRRCASAFGLSKSTVHGYMHVKLRYIDIDLYDEVQSVLDYNFSVRHLRGGESTRRKYSGKVSDTVGESIKNRGNNTEYCEGDFTII